MEITNINNRHLNVQDRVLLSLRKSILDLDLPPGTVMSSVKVADMMQVSRTPVREAFIRLEHEGLVNIFPQKETIVSLIELKRVEQEQFLRECLELAALKPFLQKCKKEDIQKLREINTLQRKQAEDGNHLGSIQCDDAFHQLIFAVAEQPLSWNVIDGMSGHFRRLRFLIQYLDKVLHKSLQQQHDSLVDALEADDHCAAQAIVRNHVREIVGKQELLYEKFPNYFSSGQTRDYFSANYLYEKLHF